MEAITKPITMVVPIVVKKRKYIFIGSPEFSKFQIGNLVIDLNDFSDAEIDMYIESHPQLENYFKAQ